jgi:ABC-type branched-subunit amino acid transport system permease subunit
VVRAAGLGRAFAALAALVVGLFVLRTKGIYFIMVTLAFAQMPSSSSTTPRSVAVRTAST